MRSDRSKLLLSLITIVACSGFTEALTLKETLGKLIFFDVSLSIQGNQSCSSCHSPVAGWSGPISEVNAAGSVYEGSIHGLFGNRNPPAVSYASYSPVFGVEFVGEVVEFVGGNFRDGRATGIKLGRPVSDQAQGPFLNPLEQALPNGEEVVARICNGTYAKLFQEVWGVESCHPGKRELAFKQVAWSLGAYEHSSEVNSFSSKFDLYIKGQLEFTEQELEGLNLFKNEAKCSTCHLMEIGLRGEPPLFTDFAFDNIGLPRNPQNPYYDDLTRNPEGREWVDYGLWTVLHNRLEFYQYDDFLFLAKGTHKASSLRNVDKRPYPEFVKSYGHNGYFKTLEGLVHFYNTRDVLPRCPDRFTSEAQALKMNCWPEPEVTDNMNTVDMGDLKLSVDQEKAIVAFLKTLSDGYLEPVEMPSE